MFNHYPVLCMYTYYIIMCPSLAVFYHDHHSRHEWNDDDVEIGRCISRKIDAQCSTSAEVNGIDSSCHCYKDLDQEH